MLLFRPMRSLLSLGAVAGLAAGCPGGGTNGPGNPDPTPPLPPAETKLELPPIYYAHRRPIVRRKGLLVPVTPLTPARADEQVEDASVRFRTVGDITCTCPVESTAATTREIIDETLAAVLTERGATRMDDQTSEASMERRKKEGYF